MEKLTKLFESGKINGMEVKNRIALAPLGHGFTFGTKPDGFLTERLLAFYEARARGGVGLIQLTVASLARPYATQLIFGPGVLGLMTEAHLPGARRFTEVMHSHGAKVSFSLGHIGAILARAIAQKPSVEYPELNTVVAPTGMRDPFTGFMTHTLTIEEMQGIIEAFGQAARRGKSAGFDAARIHCGHGYLLHEFLSPRTNKRTDDYGGSIEKRARFPIEIIRRVRKEVGADYPIIVRMNGDDHLSGGITLEEGIQHAQMFVEAGADGFSVSSGPFETHHWQFPMMYMPSGNLVPLAAAIKKAVDVPVIAVGKIDAELGERILQEGKADFIEMCRALMVDPDLPNKAREGRLEDIRPCIYCGWCQSGGTQGAYANCTVNVGMGKELEYKLEPTARPKKVMVIGGGPAGMEAARTLAERGHEVSLYERDSKLGGQWNLVSNHLPEEKRLINYLLHGLEKAGVKVYLNQAVNAQMVMDKKPEAVVVATGSTSATLNIPGIAGKKVVQAAEVLAGDAEVGQEVVIIGGRIVGLDTALFLGERGKNVSIVTRSKIGRGISHNMKQTLMESLIKYKAHLYQNAVPESITEIGVNCWWDSGDATSKDNVFFFLPADTIILAVGAVNDSILGEELSGLIPEVTMIGDCAGKRSIFSAIREGSEVGRKV